MWPISKQRGLAFHPASSFFTFTLELNLLMLIVAAVLTGLNNPVFAIPFSSQASRFQDLGNSTRNIPLISSRVDHVSLIRHARNLSSMKFFAGTNRLQSGHLDIFANKDDANIPACDVSVVLSYRERIDPVDKILQTRLDQKDVCHFHLVIILWDVPWANHHFQAYYNVLKHRPRTTILLHRGGLTCYMCLRNMALPFITDSKYTLWSDHGALWKRTMMYHLLHTMKTDRRNPVMISPYIVELEQDHDGDLMDWQQDRPRTIEDAHHPDTFLELKTSRLPDKPVGVHQILRSRLSKNPNITQVLETDLTEPHIYLTNNDLCKVIWPHDESGGQGRLIHVVSIPILRRFGRHRQLSNTAAEGVFATPEVGLTLVDAITFMWQWDPVMNIQHNHYTNAINGYLDLNFRCVHSDLSFRLGNAAQLTKFPHDPLVEASAVLGQLSMSFWNEFCFVSGQLVEQAMTPVPVLPPHFVCEKWYNLADALGWLPYVPHTGVIFRSNYAGLHSVPFNLSAAQELRQAFTDNTAEVTQTFLDRRATGMVETACLQRRPKFAVVFGLDPGNSQHAKLLNRLSPLSSLRLEYNSTKLLSGIGKLVSPAALQVQLWLSLKTRPSTGPAVPLQSFRQLLDPFIQAAGGGAQIEYLDPSGDADQQFLLNLRQQRLTAFSYYRVALTELKAAVQSQ
eukprot:m.65663 g.65663  ORF g.65663 m.65663 type:complete len:680 (-) comp13552_c0_seq2:221-2260(-)